MRDMKTRQQNSANGKHRVWLGTGLLLAAGIGTWVGTHRHPAPAPPRLVYSASGYGGFVPAAPPAPRVSRIPPSVPAVRQSGSAASYEQDVAAAYAAGRYAQVDTAAAPVIRIATLHPTLPNRRAAAQVRSLLAYAAARRHDLSLARLRFAAAEQSAVTLPDHGAQAGPLGLGPQPTLAEDAAYQHAVCTAALGNKAGAAGEYRAFMRHYPDSPLVSAAFKRVGWLYGGDAPAADVAAWRQAVATARQDQEAQARAASVCGPECLAELLRRRGQHVGVPALAHALHTTDRGTTLAALAAELSRRGFASRGLALTAAGLREQSLPVIALVTPGHYVLVDAVTPATVTVWDPDANGVGHPRVKSIPAAAWAAQWQGITLALGPEEPTVPVRTAER